MPRPARRRSSGPSPAGRQASPDLPAAETDEMSWSAPMELAAVRIAATAYLHATDHADELPDSESLADNRWLAGRRLTLLPDSPTWADAATPADREELTAQFLVA